MIYAVKIGTNSWRAAEKLADDEVPFDGVPEPDMVWDDALNNIRVMTKEEIAAIPAQKQADAELAAKAEAVAKLTDITTTEAKIANAQATAILAALNECREALGLKPVMVDEIRVATLEAVKADV